MKPKGDRSDPRTLSAGGERIMDEIGNDRPSEDVSAPGQPGQISVVPLDVRLCMHALREVLRTIPEFIGARDIEDLRARQRALGKSARVAIALNAGRAFSELGSAYDSWQATITGARYEAVNPAQMHDINISLSRGNREYLLAKDRFLNKVIAECLAKEDAP